MNKFHLITDEDAIIVSELLLKSSISSFYEYKFDKIQRYHYDEQEGCDAEETIDVYFKAIVSNDLYKSSGWKDHQVMIKLIEHDRYHDHSYFYGQKKYDNKNNWEYMFLSNHIEAIKFLLSKHYI